MAATLSALTVGVIGSGSSEHEPSARVVGEGHGEGTGRRLAVRERQVARRPGPAGVVADVEAGARSPGDEDDAAAAREEAGAAGREGALARFRGRTRPNRTAVSAPRPRDGRPLRRSMRKPANQRSATFRRVRPACMRVAFVALGRARRNVRHARDASKLISTLERRGIAYRADGDVYFDVRAYEPYGKLSHRRLDEIYRSGDIDEVFHRWLGNLGLPGPLLNAMFYLSTLPE